MPRWQSVVDSGWRYYFPTTTTRLAEENGASRARWDDRALSDMECTSKPQRRRLDHPIQLDRRARKGRVSTVNRG